MAVKLANDAAYKDDISKQILAKNHILFQDKNYEREFVQIVKDVMVQDIAKYR